jgi:oryzin
MASYFAKLAAVAALIAPLVFGAPTPAPHLKIRNSEARDVVADSYIVVYNKDVTADVIASHEETVAALISRRETTGVGATFDLPGFQGYEVSADSETIAAIANSPEVSDVLLCFGILLTIKGGLH